jgi:hypothetical protein
MAIRSHLTGTLGATHLFMLQNTARDPGSSGIPTSLSLSSASFVTQPVCEGVTASLRTNDSSSNNQDGARIGNTNDINGNTDIYRERTIILWSAITDMSRPTCIYEQGAGVNNFAFLAGLARTLTFQAADSGQPFLIAQSLFLAQENRAYFLAGIWQHHTTHPGSGNRVLFYVNGRLQDTVELTGTSVFPSHGGDIVVGNSGDSLQAYNGATMTSGSVRKFCNMLAFFNDTTLTEAELRDLFERTVKPLVVIGADTVANQQAALDALIGNSYANENCMIRIVQATDANDYRLFVDSIQFEADETIDDIHIQYVGPHTLTLEMCNGANPSVFSTPPEVDLDGSTILPGGGVLDTSITGVVRVNGVNVVSVPPGDYDKIVFEVAGTYNIIGVTANEVENVSGGAVVLTNDADIPTLRQTDGTIELTVGNFVEASFEDVTRTLVTDLIKTVLLDQGNVSADSQSITTGLYSSFFAIKEVLQSTGVPSSPTVTSAPAPYSLRAISYLYQLVQSSVAANALFDLALLMLEDSLVVETSKAIVDAYVTIDTPQQFYDRAKSFLVDNYAGETATIATRASDTIDAGSFDVVVDASAPSPFDFDGSTITIRSSNFIGNLTTTGTVSTVAGASISGVISDVSGTTGLLTLN